MSAGKERIEMDSIVCRELLQSKTTPMYVFDVGVLEQRIHFLRSHLPSEVDLCYAVKANTFLIKEVSEFVERLEICSPGELEICQRLAVSPEKFVISGVHKDATEMMELMKKETQVGMFTVESMTQFRELYQAASDCKKRIPILLRLTSGNQFGIDESVLEEIIAGYQDNPWVELRGVQYYSGTQKTSVKKLRRELNHIDDFLDTLFEKYGYHAAELEFGPGFPVAYFEGEDFDEQLFLKEFSDLITEMKFSGKITLELGRSIAACCGSYLTKVVDTKKNHGQNYAIVDGGMHQLSYFGQFMAMKRPSIRHLSSGEQKDVEDWNICGSLCTVNDILVKQLPTKALQVGDILVFENTGAYSMTEGISLFLSRDLPEILLRKQDGIIVTVRGHMMTDTLNTPHYEKR